MGRIRRGLPSGTPYRFRVALFALAAATVVFAAPAAAGDKQPGADGVPGAYVPSSLLGAAQTHPDQTFQVTVQTDGAKKGSEAAAKQIDGVRKEAPGHAYGLGDASTSSAAPPRS